MFETEAVHFFCLFSLSTVHAIDVSSQFWLISVFFFYFPGNFGQPKHKTRLVLPSVFCSGHCHGNCIHLTCDVWNSKVNIRLKCLSLKHLKTVILAKYILSVLFTFSIKPQSPWRRANARNLRFFTLFGGQFTFST